MVHESYEAVRALGGPELHALVRAGDARERVWAAWSLALALGAEHASTVARTIGHEPEPGVRRHLAVVLAGHRQLDALRALASADPAPVVRAAAVMFLFRLGALDRGDALHDDVADDDAPEVRLVVVRECSPGPWVDRYLDDPDPEICGAALDRAEIEGRWTHTLSPSLERRAQRETDPELRARLFAKMAEPDDFPDGFDEATMEYREELVARWRRSKKKLPWSKLQRLRAHPRAAELITALTSPDSEGIDWTWLAEQRPWALDRAVDVLMDRALETGRATPSTPGLRVLLERRLEDQRQTIEHMEGHEYADEPFTEQDLEEARAEYERLRASLTERR